MGVVAKAGACLLGLAVVLGSAQASAGTPLPDGPHVVVKGVGNVSRTPDVVSVSFRVQTRSPQPQGAKKIVDQAVAGLLAGAPAYGIQPEDIEAFSLDVSTRYDYKQSSQVKDGYTANRRVDVKLRQLDRLDDFIDMALAAGMTEVDSITFGFSDEATPRAEAERLAMEHAKQRAAALAQGFGATVGPVYSIGKMDESRTELYTNRALAAPGRAQSYLSPKVNFSQTVEVVFELKR